MKSQIQENICKLYLRLNGYLTNSLIIHSPCLTRGDRTDIDLIGVRFPFHKQTDRGFNSDEKLEVKEGYLELVIGEVKGQEEKLKFNKSTTDEYTDEILGKLFNWIGIFSDKELPKVIQDYKNLIRTKGYYDIKERFEVEYSLNGQMIRLRPLIFGIDRFNYRDNQIWHINGKLIIDFMWKCFRKEIENRDCQIRYDYKLWGDEFEKIVRYFKSVNEKPINFEDLYNVLAPNGINNKGANSLR